MWGGRALRVLAVAVLAPLLAWTAVGCRSGRSEPASSATVERQGAPIVTVSPSGDGRSLTFTTTQGTSRGGWTFEFEATAVIEDDRILAELTEVHRKLAVGKSQDAMLRMGGSATVNLPEPHGGRTVVDQTSKVAFSLAEPAGLIHLETILGAGWTAQPVVIADGGARWTQTVTALSASNQVTLVQQFGGDPSPDGRIVSGERVERTVGGVPASLVLGSEAGVQPDIQRLDLTLQWRPGADGLTLQARWGYPAAQDGRLTEGWFLALAEKVSAAARG